MATGRVSDARASRPLPKVSVVVPVFNGLPHLSSQLDRLLSQQCDFPWEALYVDNGSTDRSREEIARRIVEGSDPDVRLIDGSQQRGQVHARNVGAAAARADLLVFTDQDDLPEPNWLSELVSALDGSDAVGGFVQVTNHGRPPDFVGRAPDRRLPVFFGQFPVAFGTNFGIKKDTLCSAGGWQHTGVFAGEDVDLCIRLHIRNIPLTYAPQARLIWRSRLDAWGVFMQGFTYGRSDVLLFKRYRQLGASRPGWPAVLRSWKSVAEQLLRLSLGRADSLVALHQCGWAMGRVRQSIASRTIYL